MIVHQIKNQNKNYNVLVSSSSRKCVVEQINNGHSGLVVTVENTEWVTKSQPTVWSYRPLLENFVKSRTREGI